MVEKNILKKEDLLEIENYKCLETKSKMWILDLKGKYLIVKRIGKCDYKKCNSACCKFFCIDGKTYYCGFGKENEFGSTVVKISCKNLSKDGKCKLFKTRKFPRACKQFPHPTDGVYKHILDKCSFKFEVLFQIDKVGDRIREEMIKNFKEQYK